MTRIGILFPHQLFAHHPIHADCDELYIVEELLFFREFKFHKAKLAFHRASMRAFADELPTHTSKTLHYIESVDVRSDVRELISYLASVHSDCVVHCIDPTDNWLERRIRASCRRHGLTLNWVESPLFLNTKAELSSFFKPEKKSFFQTAFYKQQRIKRRILLTEAGEPEGGQWSFDADNRKAYPKRNVPPFVQHPPSDKYWDEAVQFVESAFPDNPGKTLRRPIYPCTREQSRVWLQNFLETRFGEFGIYEDAIVSHAWALHHSVLTPMLNVGLLTPEEVVQSALCYAASGRVPLNSTEGFVRQIVGWREFIRGMYEVRGSWSRTQNFWKFSRKIPASFYSGTTGIVPVDTAIKKVLDTGYCHHIERLMVLGNFMLLCEFDPDEVYRWFMELFIDAYDWVMVPNVYGMSQFADGGAFATKPYISGSNYLMKMSDAPKGEWQAVWDGLFWRFITSHRDFFTSNPRLSMMIQTWEKMSGDKQQAHLQCASAFLDSLDRVPEPAEA